MRLFLVRDDHIAEVDDDILDLVLDIGDVMPRASDIGNHLDGVVVRQSTVL